MPTRPQPPPEGRGPVLAGRSGQPRDGVVVLVVGAVLLLLLLEVVTGLDRLGSAPRGVWFFVALLVLAARGGFARSTSTEYLAVGADWLASLRSWVDLYDLVQVTGSTGRTRCRCSVPRRLRTAGRRTCRSCGPTR